MTQKTNLCVIFGGNSTEYEVSLKSSYSILTNADSGKYNITKVGITREGVWYVYNGSEEKIKDGSWKDDVTSLRRAFMSHSQGDYAVYAADGENKIERIPLDVVFPAVHGAYCEDGTLQGLLELSGIPFVGPGCASSAVCMDKAFTKMLLNNYGIPMAQCVYVTSDDVADGYDDIRRDVDETLGYPVFVKPANSGSSVGITKVKSEDELKGALLHAVKYDGKVLIEESIVGREVEVAVLGNKKPVAMSCGEIIPGAEFYDYDDKYNNGKSQYNIPAKIKKSTWLNLKRTAEGIYTYLGCRGMTRVDFFVCGKEEKIIFNELNTLPGFTSISLYPKMANEYGLKYAELIDRLVELAFENKKENTK